MEIFGEFSPVLVEIDCYRIVSNSRAACQYAGYAKMFPNVAAVSGAADFERHSTDGMRLALSSLCPLGQTAKTLKRSDASSRLRVFNDTADFQRDFLALFLRDFSKIAAFQQFFEVPFN